MSINPNRTGIALGIILGGFHFCWAILVAAGWAQPLIDFIFWLHMIKPIYVIDVFSPARAAGLIVLTGGIGYLLGLCFGGVWNGAHR